jgi:hypothetical protein
VLILGVAKGEHGLRVVLLDNPGGGEISAPAAGWAGDVTGSDHRLPGCSPVGIVRSRLTAATTTIHNRLGFIGVLPGMLRSDIPGIGRRSGTRASDRRIRR